MTTMIGRNFLRILFLTLAASLVMGVIYVLSFTSLGTAPNLNRIASSDWGEEPFQFAPEGDEFGSLETSGQGYGQGQGNGAGRHQGLGQGLGRGRGAGRESEFSLERGLPELGAHLIVVILFIAVVYYLQYLIKKRQRISTLA